MQDEKVKSPRLSIEGLILDHIQRSQDTPENYDTL